MEGLVFNTPRRLKGSFLFAGNFLEVLSSMLGIGLLIFVTFFALVSWREGQEQNIKPFVLENESESALAVVAPVTKVSLVTPDTSKAVLDREGITALTKTIANEQQLPANLLLAMIEVRSRFDIRKESPRGEKGLLQLMPRVVQEYSVVDPFSAEENIRAGALHLKAMLERFDEKTDVAVAAFLIGPAWVEYYGGVPPIGDTQAAVHSILSKAESLAGH